MLTITGFPRHCRPTEAPPEGWAGSHAPHQHISRKNAR